MTPAEYLGHIRAESERFLEVLTDCDPAARVPSCPDWDADDLLWHLATVQHFWCSIIHSRPAGPDDYQEPERPATHGEVAAFFRHAHEGLVAALAAADPEEPAWSWSGPDDQRVGFTFRRQAHEALIHRLDAEQAAGVVTPLPAALAADGVLEALDVMYGGQPPWGRFDPLPRYIEYRMTDVGSSVWAQLGTFSGTGPDGTERAEEPDQHVVAPPETGADVVVSGTAADLDAWLWHRLGDDVVTVDGAPDARRYVAAVLGQAID